MLAHLLRRIGDEEQGSKTEEAFFLPIDGCLLIFISIMTAKEGIESRHRIRKLVLSK